MRIGEVADRVGVRVSLIRYYEEIGLLPESPRVSGQRRYDQSVLRRLAVIDVAQRAGLSLDEIKELLEHGNDAMSDRLRDVAARRLPEIDASSTAPGVSGAGSRTPPGAAVSASTTAPCSTAPTCSRLGTRRRRPLP